jgi:RNA polymerase primary sigma factor
MTTLEAKFEERLDAVAAGATPERKSGQGAEAFTVSDSDVGDEPQQTVTVAGATTDPVKDYLRQIGKVALLSAEQEVELAKRIEAGLFAEEKLGSGAALDIQLRRDLEWIADNGRGARSHLLEANLRLVVSLAKRYTGLPVHMVEVINKLARVQRQMLQDLGREPTAEELAMELDMAPEKVVEVQKYCREPISLHAPLGEAGDSEFGDLIEDSQAILPLEAVSFTLLGPSYSRSPRSPRRSGDRSGPTIPTNGSTGRSDAEPTSSGSSPTAPRSSASSAPSWPSNTTNGPKPGATSASTP